MADPYVGEIRIFAGDFAPRGWVFCDGQLLQIAEHQALYSVIGTIYGGDGRTTIGVPNLKGRVPMHWGHGAGLTQRTIGQKGGVDSETLTERQIPVHNHELGVRRTTSTTEASPEGNVLTPLRGAGAFDTSRQNDGGTLAAAAVTSVGGGQAHSNLQPYGVVNYIIATDGIDPPRS